MKDFIKCEMYLRVDGFEINEDNTFQIQNITFKNDKMVKNTVKVHKSINEETLKGLIGKSVKVENVAEYKNGFKTYYSGTDIKKIDKDIDFQVNKEITLKVDNVVENKEDTTLQSLIKNNNRTDLFNIKIKGIKKSLLNDLKGKNVLIKGVNVVKTEMGTFYNSKEKPLIIG